MTAKLPLKRFNAVIAFGTQKNMLLARLMIEVLQ